MTDEPIRFGLNIPPSVATEIEWGDSEEFDFFRPASDGEDSFEVVISNPASIRLNPDSLYARQFALFHENFISIVDSSLEDEIVDEEPYQTFLTLEEEEIDFKMASGLALPLLMYKLTAEDKRAGYSSARKVLALNFKGQERTVTAADGSTRTGFSDLMFSLHVSVDSKKMIEPKARDFTFSDKDKPSYFGRPAITDSELTREHPDIERVKALRRSERDIGHPIKEIVYQGHGPLKGLTLKIILAFGPVGTARHNHFFPIYAGIEGTNAVTGEAWQDIFNPKLFHIFSDSSTPGNFHLSEDDTSAVLDWQGAEPVLTGDGFTIVRKSPRFPDRVLVETPSGKTYCIKKPVGTNPPVSREISKHVVLDGQITEFEHNNKKYRVMPGNPPELEEVHVNGGGRESTAQVTPDRLAFFPRDRLLLVADYEGDGSFGLLFDEGVMMVVPITRDDFVLVQRALSQPRTPKKPVITISDGQGKSADGRYPIAIVIVDSQNKTKINIQAHVQEVGNGEWVIAQTDIRGNVESIGEPGRPVPEVIVTEKGLAIPEWQRAYDIGIYEAIELSGALMAEGTVEIITGEEVKQMTGRPLLSAQAEPGISEREISEEPAEGPPHSDEEIAAALKKNHGDRSKAARDLNMRRPTIIDRINRSTEGSPLYEFKEVRGTPGAPPRFTDEQIAKTLEEHGGDRQLAAQELGLSESTLANHINRAAEGSPLIQFQGVYGSRKRGQKCSDQQIADALKKNNGNRVAAARELEIDSSTVHTRIREAGEGSPLKEFQASSAPPPRPPEPPQPPEPTPPPQPERVPAAVEVEVLQKPSEGEGNYTIKINVKEGDVSIGSITAEVEVHEGHIRWDLERNRYNYSHPVESNLPRLILVADPDYSALLTPEFDYQLELSSAEGDIPFRVDVTRHSAGDSHIRNNAVKAFFSAEGLTETMGDELALLPDKQGTAVLRRLAGSTVADSAPLTFLSERQSSRHSTSGADFYLYQIHLDMVSKGDGIVEPQTSSDNKVTLKRLICRKPVYDAGRIVGYHEFVMNNVVGNLVRNTLGWGVQIDGLRIQSFKVGDMSVPGLCLTRGEGALPSWVKPAKLGGIVTSMMKGDENLREAPVRRPPPRRVEPEAVGDRGQAAPPQPREGRTSSTEAAREVEGKKTKESFFDSSENRLRVRDEVARWANVEPELLWDYDSPFPHGYSVAGTFDAESRVTTYRRWGFEFKCDLWNKFIKEVEVNLNGQKIEAKFQRWGPRSFIALQGDFLGVTFYVDPYGNLKEFSHPALREELMRKKGVVGTRLLSGRKRQYEVPNPADTPSLQAALDRQLAKVPAIPAPEKPAPEPRPEPMPPPGSNPAALLERLGKLLQVGIPNELREIIVENGDNLETLTFWLDWVDGAMRDRSLNHESVIRWKQIVADFGIDMARQFMTGEVDSEILTEAMEIGNQKLYAKLVELKGKGITDASARATIIKALAIEGNPKFVIEVNWLVDNYRSLAETTRAQALGFITSCLSNPNARNNAPIWFNVFKATIKSRQGFVFLGKRNTAEIRVLCDSARADALRMIAEGKEISAVQQALVDRYPVRISAEVFGDLDGITLESPPSSFQRFWNSLSKYYAEMGRPEVKVQATQFMSGMGVGLGLGVASGIVTEWLIVLAEQKTGITLDQHIHHMAQLPPAVLSNIVGDKAAQKIAEHVASRAPEAGRTAAKGAVQQATAKGSVVGFVQGMPGFVVGGAVAEKGLELVGVSPEEHPVATAGAVLGGSVAGGMAWSGLMKYAATTGVAGASIARAATPIGAATLVAQYGLPAGEVLWEKAELQVSENRGYAGIAIDFLSNNLREDGYTADWDYDSLAREVIHFNTDRAGSRDPDMILARFGRAVYFFNEVYQNFRQGRIDSNVFRLWQETVFVPEIKKMVNHCPGVCDQTVFAVLVLWSLSGRMDGDLWHGLYRELLPSGTFASTLAGNFLEGLEG